MYRLKTVPSSFNLGRPNTTKTKRSIIHSRTIVLKWIIAYVPAVLNYDYVSATATLTVSDGSWAKSSNGLSTTLVSASTITTSSRGIWRTFCRKKHKNHWNDAKFCTFTKSIIAHRTTRKNCDLVRKGCGHEKTSTGEMIEMQITIPSTKNLFTRPIRMVQVTQYPKWANACCMNSEKQKLKIMIYQFGITYWH